MKKNIQNSLLFGVFIGITMSHSLYSISSEEQFLRINAQKYLIDADTAQINFNGWTQSLESILKTVDTKNTVLGSVDSKIATQRNNVLIFNSRIQAELIQVRSSNGNVESLLREAIKRLYSIDKTLQDQRQALLGLKKSLIMPSRRDAVDILIACDDVLRQFVLKLIKESEKKIGIYRALK